MFLAHQSVQIRKALSVKVSHSFAAGSAVFDDDHLVSCAGLVPVIALAEQTGLSRLLEEKVHIAVPRIASGAANPAPKLATVVAGMCAGADSIDDVDVVRSGGMKTLFDGVYAPSTVGTLLREFTFGHARQLESVLREHLVALCGRVELLPGADERVFVDIDSLLRPVYGHAKQGASYGHTKIAGKQILRKGLSPLATTISTPGSAPVIAGLRLRAGRANSGKGAGRMVAQAIGTARTISADTTILVRGDSAYGNRTVVRGVCPSRCRVLPDDGPQHRDRQGDRRDRRSGLDAGVLSRCGHRSRHRRLDLRCRGRRNRLYRLRIHPRSNHRPTRRTPGQGRPLPDALFPLWRYHPFFTNTDAPVDQADITHRQHAAKTTRSAPPWPPTSSSRPAHRPPPHTNESALED